MATIAELITKAETAAASNAAVEQASVTLKALDVAVGGLEARRTPAKVKRSPSRVNGLPVPSCFVGKVEEIAALKSARVEAKARLIAALKAAGVATA